MEKTFVPDRSAYEFILGRLPSDGPAVLATVVEAEESTPQVPGASAVIGAGGLLFGTVGGGIVEARTIRAGRAALARRRSRILSFNLANAYSAERDAVCGGRMTILLEAGPGENRPALRDLVAAVGRRRSGVLATFVQEKSSSVRRRWFSSAGRGPAPACRPWARFREEAAAAARDGQPRWRRVEGGWLYLEPHAPAPRLLIAGAGHVGRAVALQGKLLGFEVTVVDDRPELANGEAVPSADRFVVGPVGPSLARLLLGRDAYVVIATRGHRHDAEALRACIRRPTAYLGMIGSGRKVGLMREEFLRRGWADAAEWGRVHTPIGLPVGSRTVPEIAVSIAAEIVAARRSPSTNRSFSPVRTETSERD